MESMLLEGRVQILRTGFADGAEYWRAALALPDRDHPCEVDDRPSVTARAAGVQFVLVLVQAGESAEGEHAAPVALPRARVVRLDHSRQAGVATNA